MKPETLSPNQQKQHAATGALRAPHAQLLILGATQVGATQVGATQVDVAHVTTAQIDTLNSDWARFKVEGPRLRAIASLFRSDPIDQQSQRAWVEQNSRLHPRDPSIPMNAPSVQTLIYESKLETEMRKVSRLSEELSFAA
jgi:hypothetical protein